jgi:FkbM family methyltransferase
VADKTVPFRPFGGHPPTPGPFGGHPRGPGRFGGHPRAPGPLDDRSFAITGSEHDAGVVGELERSGGRYQSDLVLLLRRLLASDAVVVDGGAHVGVLSVLMASLAPEGHVYAFEPAPASFAHLVANLAANGVTNATPEAVALYDREAEIALDFNEAYPAGSHVGRGGSATVPTVRLDTWAKQRGLDRLDLVKLDVEGVELAALDGASETVRRLRPVVVVECNAVALRRFGGRSWRDLLARMGALFPGVGRVGAVAPGGAVVPIVASSHLELLLGDRGVVDLVGLPDARRPLQQVKAVGRAAADVARLHSTYNRWRVPSRNLLVDPRGVELRFGPAAVAGAPAEMLAVPVHVTNRSRWWLSSDFVYEPVHLAYRFYDAGGGLAVAEGHRTSFPRPLGPGRSAGFDLTVQLPAVAGRYQLAVTALQETIVWFDELEPTCDVRIPAEVAD